MQTPKPQSPLHENLTREFGSLARARTLALESAPELLGFLLDSSEFKARFFTEIGGALVFRRDDFLEFLKLELLDSSYTKFGNQIGLARKLESSQQLLKAQDDVVLHFAYKDCVLKGAQSKDEQKNSEIFFNEILAKDEIDILKEPKVLQNFEFIGDLHMLDSRAESSHTTIKSPPPPPLEPAQLKECLENTPNFLIKGNNLLALHSLKKRRDIYGQVKLIYIDPPYNTGNDSFNYNDRFSHSTWLTFMQNRLKIAREFLRDDGVICIQCDDNEQAYLKVLCDEIFGRENFVATLPRVTKKAGKSTDSVSKNHDYILMYKKKYLNIEQIEVDVNNYPLKDEFYEIRGGYKLSQTLDYDSLQYSKTMDYKAEVNGIEFYAGGKEKWLERQKGNYKKIDWVWRWSKEKLEFGISNGFVEIKGNRIYTKTYFKATISREKPYKVESIIRGKNLTSLEFIENQYSNDMASKNIQQVFNEKNLFNYSKPEALLQKIIELTTNENDLVMDFFAGSGTTLAVAMKMNRRFVGIEQMDYIESITKERLKKVIAGEQGGISKAVGWQGGGGFIYAELMPLNAIYKERILSLRESGATEAIHKKADSVDCHEFASANSRNDDRELEQIYKDLESKAFIDYRVDIRAMLQSKEFHKLSLSEKKQVLYAILDSNMDYVPYGDIEDSSYGVSDEIVELNKIFYGDCHEFASANSANDKKGGNDE